jgi:CHAT domain-containing protein
MVLGPIASHLGEKRLVIVADGTLQMLPFAVLPAPQSPSLLLERHEIVNSPSASVLVLQRRELAGRKPAPDGVAVIADPVFDELDARVAAKGRRLTAKNTAPSPNAFKDGQPQTRALIEIGEGNRAVVRRLSFSLDEARAIFKLVTPNQTLKALDFEASRATLLNPQLSRYRVIHLATHGIMNLRHPELSGIILSMVDAKGRPVTGYVGLNDIYNLNLPADLVVLSACETGIGKQIKGEGLIALTRGFMHAGGERLVASLWRVNDRATADLMAEFYKEMFVNKRSAAAALRAAQLELHRRNLKPHLWAGFVLQGEWR